MHTPPIEPGSILCQCYAKLPVLAPSAVAVAKAFVKTGDLQYHAAPAFLSGFEYSADDDPDKLWSLRFFNDYEMGQCASHATATSRRPWLPPRHPPELPLLHPALMRCHAAFTPSLFALRSNG